jgi:dynein heavy chain
LLLLLFLCWHVSLAPQDNIPVKIMAEIRAKYMEDPEFEPDKVAKASSAAEGLCRWVRAMEVYDRVAKVSFRAEK